MIEFFQNNMIACVVGIIIVIALIVYIIKNRKNVLQKAALYAVATAEEAWSSNTGQIKFAEVYTYIKKKYPIITFFLSEDTMKKIIEEALSTFKEIVAERTKKLSDTEVQSKDEPISAIEKYTKLKR